MGIVDSPTIAQIGEKGQEAVLPLSRHTEWQDSLASKLASKINLNSNNGPQDNRPVILSLNMDGREVARGTLDAMEELARVNALDISFF